MIRVVRFVPEREDGAGAVTLDDGAEALESEAGAVVMDDGRGGGTTSSEVNYRGPKAC